MMTNAAHALASAHAPASVAARASLRDVVAWLTLAATGGCAAQVAALRYAKAADISAALCDVFCYQLLSESAVYMGVGP